jgi:hypothetical protein
MCVRYGYFTVGIKVFSYPTHAGTVPVTVDKIGILTPEKYFVKIFVRPKFHTSMIFVETKRFMNTYIQH